MIIKNPVNFITISHERNDSRINKFYEYLKITEQQYSKSRKEIEKILDFVSDLDKIDKYSNEKMDFLFDAHHNTLSSDIFSIILLYLSNQKIQMNIILRHFIETIIYCLFSDLISNFEGTFFPLYYSIWKPYRQQYRLSWKDNKNRYGLKTRLNDIKSINNIKNKNFESFYKYYFSKATYKDRDILFSLPICKECYNKKSTKEKRSQFLTITTLRKDITDARFQTSILNSCNFCSANNRITHYTYGITDTDTMYRLLKYRLPNFKENISKIYNIWDVLSEEFVHFGTDKYVNKKKMIINVPGIGEIDFYNLENLCYIFEIIRPILKFYINKLKRVDSQTLHAP